jgi:ABC-2 type transport system ATP-binding protein
MVLDTCDLERRVSERKIGNLSKGYRQRVGIADALLAEPRLVILDEPTIGLDPRQSAITRKMMERLRGEVSFLLSSHILSEVEACCDRMIILSHGQIVAEGTMNDLQNMYINKTIFEIVSPNTRIELHRVIRQIDPSCELLSDDSVDVSQKNRFTFSTSLGEEKAEEVLRGLIKDDQLRISEFQMSRPDLETIFLRATKKNWEDQDYLGRKKKLKQQATAVG